MTAIEIRATPPKANFRGVDHRSRGGAQGPAGGARSGPSGAAITATAAPTPAGPRDREDPQRARRPDRAAGRPTPVPAPTREGGVAERWRPGSAAGTRGRWSADWSAAKAGRRAVPGRRSPAGPGPPGPPRPPRRERDRARGTRPEGAVGRPPAPVVGRAERSGAPRRAPSRRDRSKVGRRNRRQEPNRYRAAGRTGGDRPQAGRSRRAPVGRRTGRAEPRTEPEDHRRHSAERRTATGGPPPGWRT